MTTAALREHERSDASHSSTTRRLRRCRPPSRASCRARRAQSWPLGKVLSCSGVPIGRERRSRSPSCRIVPALSTRDDPIVPDDVELTPLLLLEEPPQAVTATTNASGDADERQAAGVNDRPEHQALPTPTAWAARIRRFGRSAENDRHAQTHLIPGTAACRGCCYREVEARISRVASMYCGRALGSSEIRARSIPTAASACNSGWRSNAVTGGAP